MLSHIPAVAAKIIVFEALLLAVMSQLLLSFSQASAIFVGLSSQ